MLNLLNPFHITRSGRYLASRIWAVVSIAFFLALLPGWLAAQPALPAEVRHQLRKSVLHDIWYLEYGLELLAFDPPAGMSGGDCSIVDRTSIMDREGMIPIFIVGKKVYGQGRIVTHNNDNATMTCDGVTASGGGNTKFTHSVTVTGTRKGNYISIKLHQDIVSASFNGINIPVKSTPFSWDKPVKIELFPGARFELPIPITGPASGIATAGIHLTMKRGSLSVASLAMFTGSG